jgi:MarR family transcriptional regulator, organic hydroperoxide resistance regulator
MRLLWELVHSLERASKRMNQQLGITGPQRLTLRVVGLFPGISAGQLAHILHIHPSTLTGVLRRLIHQRLVARSEAASDRRRVQLRLTPRGARINQRATGTVESAVSAALKRSPRRDRPAAQRLVSGLSAQLHRQLALARSSRPGGPLVRLQAPQASSGRLG